jgi:hypothetical protein
MERQNQAQADTFLQGLQAESIEALQGTSISLTDRSSAFVHTGLTLTLKPGLAFSLSPIVSCYVARIQHFVKVFYSLICFGRP